MDVLLLGANSHDVTSNLVEGLLSNDGLLGGGNSLGGLVLDLDHGHLDGLSFSLDNTSGNVHRSKLSFELGNLVRIGDLLKIVGDFLDLRSNDLLLGVNLDKSERNLLDSLLGQTLSILNFSLLDERDLLVDLHIFDISNTIRVLGDLLHRLDDSLSLAINDFKGSFGFLLGDVSLDNLALGIDDGFGVGDLSVLDNDQVLLLLDKSVGHSLGFLKGGVDDSDLFGFDDAVLLLLDLLIGLNNLLILLADFRFDGSDSLGVGGDGDLLLSDSDLSLEVSDSLHDLVDGLGEGLLDDDYLLFDEFGVSHIFPLGESLLELALFLGGDHSLGGVELLLLNDQLRLGFVFLFGAAHLLDALGLGGDSDFEGLDSLSTGFDFGVDFDDLTHALVNLGGGANSLLDHLGDTALDDGAGTLLDGSNNADGFSDSELSEFPGVLLDFHKTGDLSLKLLKDNLVDGVLNHDVDSLDLGAGLGDDVELLFDDLALLFDDLLGEFTDGTLSVFLDDFLEQGDLVSGLLLDLFNDVIDLFTGLLSNLRIL